MKTQRASALLLGLLGTAVSCTQLVLSGDYRQSDATASSGASSAGGSSDGQPTSTITSTGAGSPNCPSGYTSCGGECVLIASDPKHCGACERDCQGQPCVTSVCDPIVLADGQDVSGYIAVDASGIYWTEGFNGAVRRAPLDGSGGVTKLGSGPGEGSGIVLNGGFVYWANQGSMPMNGTIKRVPVTGGTPETFVSGERKPEVLAATPTHLFWSDNQFMSDPHNVRKKAFDAGSTPATIATTNTIAWSVTCDQKNVYAVTGEGLLQRFSLTGDEPTTVTDMASAARHMAVAGSYIYYTTYASGTVERVPISGGSPETFYDGSTEGVKSTYGITADAKYVYWTEDHGGIVRKAPISGGPWKASTTAVLAVGQGTPTGIAVDSAYVYWANSVGSLMKTPK